MTGLKRLLVLAMLLAVVGAVLAVGCSKFNPGEPRDNIPPDTKLSFSPDSGSTASYRVRMNWFGWDPDGEVVYYETAWDWPETLILNTEDEWDAVEDTLNWRRVISTDSIFVLSASADVGTEFGYEYHRFAVRAVDNGGARDPLPESIEFNASTLVPNTVIVRGPSGVTGPVVTFEWQGSDDDGVITGYGYQLFRQEAGQWQLQTEADNLPANKTTETFPLPAFKYRFDVWSYDDAGASDRLTPARRTFICNPALAGARLMVGTNVFGTLQFQGPVWGSAADIPTSIFKNERLSFRWSATAEDYGGQIVGYRHAYDDTSTWPAYSVFDRSFQVVPDVGKHSLYINVLDNANVVTRARIFFDVVEAGLDSYILIVDDWDLSEESPTWGTDEDRTSFYDLLLAGYVHPRFEWEPSENTQGGSPQPPSVEVLQGASTVIWYADEGGTVLRDVFDPGTTTYNAIAGYLRVGGNMIMCGRDVLYQITEDSYPITIEASDTTRPAVFVRDYLHIGFADNSGESANKNDPENYGYCFYGAVPADPTMFEPMYIDSLGKWSYIYSYPNPNYNKGGLSKVERLAPYLGTGLEAFVIDSHINTVFEGATCCVLSLSGDNHNNVCYFGFPLYYLQTDQVQAVMDAVLALFGEEKG